MKISSSGQISTSPENSAERAAIETLVQRLFELRGAGEEVPALEAELNQRVYDLFGLCEDKVKIV